MDTQGRKVSTTDASKRFARSRLYRGWAKPYFEIWHSLWQRDENRSASSRQPAPVATEMSRARSFIDHAIPAVLFGTCLLLFAGFAYVASKQQGRRWESFKATHDCKRVGYMAGNFDKEGWLCNDGMTYWKAPSD